MIIGMRRHSDEDLLRVMREVAARHGRCSLTAFDRDRRDGLVKIWPQTISHRFGSWDAALMRAGLPLNHSEHAVINIIHICQPLDTTKLICTGGPAARAPSLSYSEASRLNLMSGGFCKACRDGYLEVESERDRTGYYDR
jgi:hypothetical protein